MIVVGYGNRYLQCDGVREVGVLDEYGGLTVKGGAGNCDGYKKNEDTKILKGGVGHVG